MATYNAETWARAWERGEVRAGDYVTGDVVNDMMNALPPVCMRTSCAQLGEPYAHACDESGRYRPLFWTWRLVERGTNAKFAGGNVWGEGATWEFCGACFAGETINREERYEPAPSEVA